MHHGDGSEGSRPNPRLEEATSRERHPDDASPISKNIHQARESL